MSKKKRYNFTLDEDLMMWFKMYCKENRITASAEINNQIFEITKLILSKLSSMPIDDNEIKNSVTEAQSKSLH